MKHALGQRQDRPNFSPAELNELTQRQHQQALRVPGAAREDKGRRNDSRKKA